MAWPCHAWPGLAFKLQSNSALLQQTQALASFTSSCSTGHTGLALRQHYWHCQWQFQCQEEYDIKPGSRAVPAGIRITANAQTDHQQVSESKRIPGLVWPGALEFSTKSEVVRARPANFHARDSGSMRPQTRFQWRLQQTATLHIHASLCSPPCPRSVVSAQHVCDAGAWPLSKNRKATVHASSVAVCNQIRSVSSDGTLRREWSVVQRGHTNECLTHWHGQLA
jgi:hypothetical protein